MQIKAPRFGSRATDPRHDETLQATPLPLGQGQSNQHLLLTAAGTSTAANGGKTTALELISIRYALLWHQRLHHDPGHIWLRKLFYEELPQALQTSVQA